MTDQTERDFSDTRRRILTMLRRSERTVNDLAEALNLADNSIRAHLASLEREGLVVQTGTRPGRRKPHFMYRLTQAAEPLFLRACDPVLDKLLDALSERVLPGAMDEVLADTGRRMAEPHVIGLAGATPAQRLEKALEVLRELGGVVELEESGGKLFLQGYRCPLSAVVSGHPRICLVAEKLVSAIVDAPVRERCERGTTPHCRFEIGIAAGPASFRPPMAD